MGRRELLRVEARIEVEYKSFEQFYREYTKDISRGGLFIRTRNTFKPQTVLEINLRLPGYDKPFNIVGEVVHSIDVETAEKNGWEPGMGIQIVDFEEGATRALEGYVSSRLKENPLSTPDRRKHARVPVRLRVKFPSLEVLQEDYSKDISRGGIFIQTQKPRGVGDEMIVTLVHPVSGEELDLDGEVVRVSREESHKPGSVSGMGIQFKDMDQEKVKAVERFLDLDLPPGKAGTRDPDNMLE